MMQDIGIDAVAKANKGGYKLYRSKGCEQCGFTGYRGRLGIYEVLHFNDAIRRLIRD